MRDWIGPDTRLGYCTNVHPGPTLEQTKENLQRYAVRVKEHVSPDAPMGVGLWLSAAAARELVVDEQIEGLGDWLGERGLDVFTINGFPYHDFHQPTVKHRVYHPDWSTEEREAYTIDLLMILAQLLPKGGEGSVSTLPVKWRQSDWDASSISPTARLQRIARRASDIYDRHGKLLHVDIEPEPGCMIDRAEQLVGFFREELFAGEDEEVIRRHIRVCHDICHSAVMFEDQHAAIDRYRAAGITVGKVQVSSAIRADLQGYSARERTDAIAQLRQFAEDRYLHQTMIRDGEQMRFQEDLPLALQVFGQSDRAGDEWRIHYHVPIFLEAFDLLQTTRAEITTCLDLLHDEVNHWEVETYAWSVLPDALQPHDLSTGIADEMKWLIDLAKRKRAVT